jgi:hypothetical protein
MVSVGQREYEQELVVAHTLLLVRDTLALIEVDTAFENAGTTLHL